MTATSLLQTSERLILASASQSRAALLKAAGLEFAIAPAGIDEEAVREALRGDAAPPAPADVAEILARAKAEAVSGAAMEAIVIGADQVLALGNDIMAKPAGMAEARAMLLRLAGKTHHLHTGVCVARAGQTVWSRTDTAALTMRPLTPAFVGRYLAAAGEGALSSVGAYQIESLGIHLFAEIEGDFFTILGLPLLPLLNFLRAHGVDGG